jgi:hypothetical protein
MPARHAAPVGRARIVGEVVMHAAEAVAHPDEPRRRRRTRSRSSPCHRDTRLRCGDRNRRVAVSVGVARRRGIDGAVEGADRPLSSRNENAGYRTGPHHAQEPSASGAAADTVRADPRRAAQMPLSHSVSHDRTAHPENAAPSDPQPRPPSNRRPSPRPAISFRNRRHRAGGETGSRSCPPRSTHSATTPPIRTVTCVINSTMMRAHWAPCQPAARFRRRAIPAGA